MVLIVDLIRFQMEVADKVLNITGSPPAKYFDALEVEWFGQLKQLTNRPVSRFAPCPSVLFTITFDV